MKEGPHVPRKAARTQPTTGASVRIRPSHAAEDAISRFLLRLVDVGLAGVIFLAPLFMGGRYDVGRLVYVAIVCFTAVCWAARQCLASDARWRWSGAELILLGGVLVILLQLIPLPQTLLLQVSPEIGELLPLWFSQTESAAQMGTWNELSLTPQATRGGFVTFLAHAMLFLVVVQRIREFRDIERLMRWLALAAVAMAVLGLAQFLLGNGKFLWIYEHPSRDTARVVKGTFQNQNHFAHFLALGIGPLIWWLQRRWASREDKRRSFGKGGRGHKWNDVGKQSLAIGLGLVALAGLLTFSRGGVVAMFTAAVICLIVLVRKRLLGRKSLVAIAGLATLLIGALAIHGYEPLAKRLATLRDSRSLEELSHGRKALWAAHAKAIPRFALTGTGVGSHGEVYQTYLDKHFDVAFTHGENGYLHLLLETGFPGLMLMLAAAGLAFYWCIRTLVTCGATGESRASRVAAEEARVEGPESKEKRKNGPKRQRSSVPSATEAAACAAALLAGLAASMVHSFGDFVWYIPACMSLTIIVAACACRLFQIAAKNERTSSQPTLVSFFRPLARVCQRLFVRNEESQMPRFAWITGAAVLFGAVGIMLANRIPPALSAPHWDAYFRLARTTRGISFQDEAGHESVPELRRHLEELLGRDPYNARANVRLADIYLRLFAIEQQRGENPMPLSQIRDAALASPFESREAQDEWLSLVLGENRAYLDKAIVHAKRGLRLCPLQGKGYVYLAELAFLDSNSPERKHAYVAQGLRVRPHDGSVLFAAGKEAMLAGDTKEALDLWKRAFHQDPEQQSRIIEMLASQTRADDFLQHFEPDLAGLANLYSHYRKNNRMEEARYSGSKYVVMLEHEAETERGIAAAGLWDQARGIHEFVGDIERAADCARRAVAQAPGDFGKHRNLAGILLRSGQYDEAVRELQWCLSRQPDDKNLRQLLQTASRARIEQDGATTMLRQDDSPHQIQRADQGQGPNAVSNHPNRPQSEKSDLAAFGYGPISR